MTYKKRVAAFLTFKGDTIIGIIPTSYSEIMTLRNNFCFETSKK